MKWWVPSRSVALGSRIGSGDARPPRACYHTTMLAVLRALGSSPVAVRATTACSVVAGPLFVSAFTALGRRRAGYDWRRHGVSSLADGREGWAQRVNFVLAGGLYCTGAAGLARSPRQIIGPPVVPALIFGAGAGLIGSGLFVTDPVAGFPPSAPNPEGVDGPPPRAPATRAGTLHNLCAIPIFIGVPVTALTCAVSAARRSEYRWAVSSAGSAMLMFGTSLLFGAAFDGVPGLAGHGGVFQRISITTGFGWISALSLRAMTCPRST